MFIRKLRIQNRRPFRVLLLDDSKHLIDRVQKRHLGARLSDHLKSPIPVEVILIPVTLSNKRTNEGAIEIWTFGDEFLEKLASACTISPDLIIVDYGFVDPITEKGLRETANIREVTRDELKGKVLTIQDLVLCINNDPRVKGHTKHMLTHNFLSCGAPVYLYSYRSKEFIRAFGPIQDREVSAKESFLRSDVFALDTKVELYNDDEFDQPNSSKRDAEFYSYQLSVLLDGIVERELLKSILDNSKYLSIPRTVRAAAVVTAIGSAIGFASGWAGGLILELIRAGNIRHALVVATAIILLIFLLGILTPVLFEKYMLQIIEQKEDSD